MKTNKKTLSERHGILPNTHGIKFFYLILNEDKNGYWATEPQLALGFNIITTIASTSDGDDIEYQQVRPITYGSLNDDQFALLMPDGTVDSCGDIYKSIEVFVADRSAAQKHFAARRAAAEQKAVV